MKIVILSLFAAGISDAAFAQSMPGAIAGSNIGAAQSTNAALEIVVPDRALSGLPRGRPLFEPHLAASPFDPRHLVGAAILADPAAAFGPLQKCIGIVTFDAGDTWQSHEFDLRGCGDPWVAIGSDGAAWFSALGQRAEVGSHRMYVYRSADGGRTWKEAPADFGGGHDHQTLIAGQADRGGTYVVSSLGRRTDAGNYHAFIARYAADSGGWQTPVLLTPSNLNFTTLAGGILQDRTLLVPFIDSQRPESGGMLARRRAWVYRVAADVSASSAPILISEECTSNSGFGSVIAIPATTRAVFTCINGSGSVIVHTSEDGRSWSDVRPVEPRPGVLQRVPALAASTDGTVALAWMDGRAVAEGCFTLRAAFSSDVAKTFTSSQSLSTEASCPQSSANGAGGRRWRHGGDYSGLAASADGRFHALWADSRSGLSELRFASFRKAVQQ